jgi:hypothetical protein
MVGQRFFQCFERRAHARANGAQVNSPGQRPVYRARVFSSVRRGGRKDSLRPFRAHCISNDSETQGVALGWLPSALSAPKNNVALSIGLADQGFRFRSTPACWDGPLLNRNSGCVAILEGFMCPPNIFPCHERGNQQQPQGNRRSHS